MIHEMCFPDIVFCNSISSFRRMFSPSPLDDMKAEMERVQKQKITANVSQKTIKKPPQNNLGYGNTIL